MLGCVLKLQSADGVLDQVKHDETQKIYILNVAAASLQPEFVDFKEALSKSVPLADQSIGRLPRALLRLLRQH